MGKQKGEMYLFGSIGGKDYNTENRECEIPEKVKQRVGQVIIMESKIGVSSNTVKPNGKNKYIEKLGNGVTVNYTYIDGKNDLEIDWEYQNPKVEKKVIKDKKTKDKVEKYDSSKDNASEDEIHQFILNKNSYTGKYKTITDKLIPIGNVARPKINLTDLRGVVVHYVANTKSTALNNKRYWENIIPNNIAIDKYNQEITKKYPTPEERKKNHIQLKSRQGVASAHYVIDLNGDRLLCIPENEMAYHCGAEVYMSGIVTKIGSYPNSFLLGIECTHIDKPGKPTIETLDSLIELLIELCKKYKLDKPKEQIYLHFDITGKECHKWFTDHPKHWIDLKNKVFELSK